MPVRKKTRVTQQHKKETVPTRDKASQDCSVKSRGLSPHMKTATDRAVVIALKENNKCLAAALDESRHDLRKLQTKYVSLQRERQQLLEKMANMENKISHQNLLFSQIQPALHLLKQATKDIIAAEEHMKGIFFVHEKELSKKYESRSNSISAPPSSPILAENETAFVPNTSLEANKSAEDRAYLGTPYSACQEPCLPINSTPLYDHERSARGLRTCQRCALEFGGSIIGTVSGSITKTEKVERSWDKLDKWESSPDYRIDSASVQRPQRKCATINISYQEPNLRRKLCESDLVDTSLSVRALRSHYSGKSQSAQPKCTQRLALQDISNRVKQKGMNSPGIW